MKNSSNELMENVFDALSSVKSVPPNGDLYRKTLMKIECSRGVSVYWVRTAAAALLLFLGAELYAVLRLQYQKNGDVPLIVCETNNQLYHE
jgi:hypothetical protein